MALYCITLSALIVIVFFIRAVFRKSVSPVVIYALWLAVAIKFCLPLSLFEMQLPMPYEHAAESETIPEPPPETVGTEAAEETAGVVVPERVPTENQPIPVPVVPAVPTTAPSVTVPPETTVPAAAETTGNIASAVPIIPDTEAVVTDIPTDVPDIPEETVPMDWRSILLYIWAAGAAVLALWFALSGGIFHYRLYADRRLYIKLRKTRVYISSSAGAPCLAGIIPAIYITPEAAESDSRRLIVLHEYFHLRHGDHIWSLIRMLALIVHWWNPLVWAAAFVSKQDAELACDHAIASQLNDSRRIEYARILLDTVPQKHRYAVGLGSEPMRERILMLTKRHRNYLICAVTAAVLALCAVGCSFIGAYRLTMDNISEQRGFVITGQTTERITLQIPKSALPAYSDLASAENPRTEDLQIPVYETDTSTVFLHTVGIYGHAPESAEEDVMYLGFDIRHDLPETGTVLCVNARMYENERTTYTSVFSIPDGQITDEQTVYNGAVREMGNGPGDNFFVYIDAVIYKKLQGTFSFDVTLNAISYTRGDTPKEYTHKDIRGFLSEEDRTYLAELTAQLAREYGMYTEYQAQLSAEQERTGAVYVQMTEAEMEYARLTALYEDQKDSLSEEALHSLSSQQTQLGAKLIGIRKEWEQLDSRLAYLTQAMQTQRMRMDALTEQIYAMDPRADIAGFQPEGMPVFRYPDEAVSIRLTASLPAEAKSALMALSPVGGTPMYYLYAPGMTYYRHAGEGERELIHECTLKLPDGYENGSIIYGFRGAAEQEIQWIVQAEFDGRTAYLVYTFRTDSDALSGFQPIWVSTLTEAQMIGQYGMFFAPADELTALMERVESSEGMAASIAERAYPIVVTGLRVPVTLQMHGERVTAMEVHSQCVTLLTPRDIYGNCYFDLFEADGAVILAAGYYRIGEVYAVTPDGCDMIQPGAESSYFLYLDEAGQLQYSLSHNAIAGITQTGALSVAVSREDFLYAAGDAHIRDGKIVFDPPRESYTVSDKYDLDKEFREVWRQSYASIEEKFAANKAALTAEKPRLQSTGPFVGYLASRLSPMIDIYTEENGTYITSVPWEILEQFPATDRSRADYPTGWMAHIPFYYGEIGDFRWAVVCTGPSAGTGNENVCTSSDGGRTWWVGDAYSNYSGTCTGAAFASENVGFMSYRYWADFGPEIARTTDGGKTWHRLPLTVPETLKGQRMTPGIPVFDGQNGLYPIDIKDGDTTTATVYLLTSDGGMTWTWKFLPEQSGTDKYVLPFPEWNNETRETPLSMAVYGRSTGYSFTGGEIWAGEDGVRYAVYGIQNGYTGRISRMITYRIESAGGSILSIEEVPTFTRADILQYGKPYMGNLNGEFACKAYNKTNNDLIGRKIYMDNGTMSVSAYLDGTDAGGTYEGTYTYDAISGTLSAVLTSRTFSNEVIRVSEPMKISGKLYEYGGFVHFLCENSEMRDITPEDPLPLTFLPDPDAKSEEVLLGDGFAGEWYHCFYDKTGAQFYYLGIDPRTREMQFEYGCYQSEYINYYKGTFTVNPVTYAVTAVMHDDREGAPDPDITMTLILGYVMGEDGHVLTVEMESCSVERYQPLIGRWLSFRQEMTPLAELLPPQPVQVEPDSFSYTFEAKIFASETRLYFPEIPAGSRTFAVYHSENLGKTVYKTEYTIPEKYDFDSAEIICCGGGGGSGECQFLIRLTQGETVRWLAYNNYTFGENQSYLEFRCGGILPDDEAEDYYKYAGYKAPGKQ